MRKLFLLITLLLIAAGHAFSRTGPGDSAVARATTKYATASPIRLIFIGTNYRRDWATPVKMKVFNPASEKGGLKITGTGGGMQTKSLRLTDSKGQEWALRTVDKTVDIAMEAEGIKNPLIKAVAQDIISAAHPYGALTIPPMAKALGLIVPEPELLFVPDIPALGKYRESFANTVCMLEEREPAPGNADTLSTKDLEKGLAASPANTLDKKMLLQARLLDMLIADWDRHDDQWRWGQTTDASGAIHYFPIPRDRDQAFFRSNGILVPMVRPFTMQHFVGFRRDGKKLIALNRKEWSFDYKLMEGLTERDWKEGIATFQSRLSNDVLMQAVKRLPAEIYALRGEEFYYRLRTRRDAMDEEVMRYYDFLAHANPADFPLTPMQKREAEKKEAARKESAGAKVEESIR